MNNRFKKIVSLLLAMVMMMSVPMFAMAENADDMMITPFSLFPIEEQDATIDLTAYTADDLMSMTVGALFSNLKNYNDEPIVIDETATTVWSNFYDEDGYEVYDTWKVLSMTDTIDVLTYYIMDNYSVEIIIGSGNQLDDTNVRYFVDFELPTVSADMDLTSFMYPELTNIQVSELIENLTVDGEPLTITEPESVEILWDIRDFNDNEIDLYLPEYAEGVTNPDWAKLTLNNAVKFAPETADRRMMNIYNWQYQTMFIKADGVSTLYYIDVEYPGFYDMFDFNLYTQGEESTRTKVELDDMYEYNSRWYVSEDEYKDLLSIYGNVNSSYSETDDYYLGFDLKEEFKSEYEITIVGGWDYDLKELGVKIFEGQDIGEADITEKFTVADMTVVDAGVKAKWLNWCDEGQITIYIKGENSLWYEPLRLDFTPNRHSVNVGYGIYADGEGGRENITYSRYNDWIEEEVNDYWYQTEIETFYLDEGYFADAEYSISMSFYDGDLNETTYDTSKIDKAVVGHFYSLEEATNADDIKEQLFVENMYETNAGYKDNFSGDGVDFTIFSGDDLWHIRVIVADREIIEDDGAPNVGSNDRYFNVYDLYSGDEELDTYVIPYEHDTYYSYGYQAVLINDSEVDMTAVAPYIYMPNTAKVYYNDFLEETNGYYNKLVARDFTGTPVDITRDPIGSIKYTVSAENHIDQKNYWITAVKKTAGSKLFVNGPDEREVFLNNYFDNAHDIFVANVGDEELTGITVTLDATNVKLDDYWTIGGAGNDTLAPFTTTNNNTGNYHGELFNVAKIRLIPDGEGDIDGTLTITADGQEPRVIHLTGTAGNPKIDTATIHDAVKYVPYSAIITTNNMHDWNKVTFELASGELPEGVQLYPSGEIYGVPKETGEFPIRVRANYSHSEFDDSYADFTLVVKDNTDENVNATVDEGYEITIRVPDFTTYTDREFEIEGVLAEFVDFWLDGEKLEKDVDYTAEEGSTKITIKSQTFSNAGNGKHTISAEFRVDGDRNKDLKKASQNYNKTSGGSGHSGGGGGGGASSYKVWFEVNGGAWLDAVTVKRNATLENVPTPEKAGYTFGGWFTDKALTKPFDTSKKINATTTLYAKWIENYTIWLIENGGEELADVSVQNGKAAPTLPTPVKSGYVFDGWYKDEALTQPFDNAEVLTASISVYAKWVEDKAPVDASGFIDVSTTDWFYNDVKWAYENKYMVGTSNVIFAPNDAITGGMVVTVLARIAGVDVSEYADTEFDDVYEGEWYTPYAKWAKAIGLVDGIPFNPPTEISREAMGVILARFIEYMEAEYEITDEFVQFADADLISDEAMDAMQTLFKLEIFKGKGNNVIDPLSSTTRAEFSALVHRVAAFLNK